MGLPTKFIDKDGTEKMFNAMLEAVDKRIAKIPTGGGNADSDVYKHLYAYNEGTTDTIEIDGNGHGDTLIIQGGKGIRLKEDYTYNGKRALSINPDTGILATREYVSEELKKVPSSGGEADWSALEGQSGFIKNKPFGYYGLDQIISFTPDMVQEGDPFGWGGSFYFASVPVDSKNKLTIGDVYMVQLGNDAPAFSQCRPGNEKGEVALNIGFGQLNTTTIEDVQHFVFIAEKDFIGKHIKVWRTGIDKIDERFLPDFVTEMRDKIDRLTKVVFG